MALLPDEAVAELLRTYGEEELQLVRGLIGSSTLRAAAELLVEEFSTGGEQKAVISIPHYWAAYYHDGRAGFEAPAGHLLVFFADEDDDPRLEGGRPVRLADVRHLTREEFRRGLEENELRAAAGEGPFMFVVRAVGPAGPHPFFDELSIGAAARMDQLALAALDAHVQELLDEERGQRATAQVRL